MGPFIVVNYIPRKIRARIVMAALPLAAVGRRLAIPEEAAWSGIRQRLQTFPAAEYAAARAAGFEYRIH